MFWVKALNEGVWRSHRHFVRALEESNWCVDHAGVEALPGLVISFRDEEDAKHFMYADRKTPPRAEPVTVVPGMPVAFHFEPDAKYVVDQGWAIAITEREAAEIYQQMDPQAPASEAGENGEEGDDVDKTKLENKGGAPAPETKTADKPKSKKKAQ